MHRKSSNVIKKKKMNIAKFDSFGALIDQEDTFHGLIYFKFLRFIARTVRNRSSQAVLFASIQQLLLKNKSSGLNVFVYKWLFIHQLYIYHLLKRLWRSKKTQKG